MTPVLDTILTVLRDAQKVVITTHVNPDGDGLGSEIAMGEWLAGRGKQVSILNHSSTPAVYLFLDPHHRIRVFNEERDASAVAEADLILILDTNQPERLRSLQPHVLASRAVKVCIDHHLEPSPFADHELLDDDATSTGEIVYRLMLELNGRRLHPLVAQALYCAIMTDTGSFRYPRVDPEIHQIVSHLIECGADPVAVYSSVYERWSPGRIRLLGEMLASLAITGNGRIASVTVTQDMLKRTETGEEDTDNFTTYPMSVEGVQVGILFLELPRGLKISFRSKGDIPINELAKEFGGNGHKNAAGARLYQGTLEEIRSTVLSAAEKYLLNDDFMPG